MRRMRFFASRNAREILRDPISVGFGVAFPILLLLLLSFLNRHIPAEAHMTLFEPEQLAPGVSVFSLSFLALFSALLLSRDRSSALILRLYASPLTGRDFILGYLLPMLPWRRRLCACWRPSRSACRCRGAFWPARRSTCPSRS